jgi:hypothetical protein
MFMTLAKIWQQIEKEQTQLQARANLFECLSGVKGNFASTLTAKDVTEASTSHVPETGMNYIALIKPLLIINPCCSFRS